MTGIYKVEIRKALLSGASTSIENDGNIRLSLCTWMEMENGSPAKQRDGIRTVVRSSRRLSAERKPDSASTASSADSTMYNRLFAVLIAANKTIVIAAKYIHPSRIT